MTHSHTFFKVTFRRRLFFFFFILVLLINSSNAQLVGENFDYISSNQTANNPFVDNVNFANAWASGKTNGLVNTNVWKANFLSDIENYSVLRFLNWAGTNGNSASEWSDVYLPTDQNNNNIQGFSAGYIRPMAYEWQIDLCNRVGADLWITVPAHTDTSHSDYWGKLAVLIRDNLDESLQVYVEYSNEIWNFGFEQRAYTNTRAQALGIPGDDNTRVWKYTVKASVDLWQVFINKFGTSGRSRLQLVLPGQAANSYMAGFHYGYLSDITLNPNGLMPDAYAVAPYVGHTVSTDQASADVFTALTTEMNNSTLPTLSEHKDLAEDNGVELIAYEGGQHLTAGAKVATINRDARMYNFYTEYLDSVSKYLSLIMDYHYSGSFSDEWGNAWGSKESINQSIDDAHKFRAIQDWISGNSEPTYTLIVENGNGSGSYNEGEIVNISATLPVCGTFINWTGTGADSISDVNSATTTLTMPASAITVTANANTTTCPEYTLIVTNGSGDGDYIEGTSVDILADVAPIDKQFSKWTGDITNIVNVNAASTSIEMHASNASIEATYEDIPVITGYKYLKFTATGGSNIKVNEVEWMVGAISHPTSAMTSNNSAGAIASGGADVNSYKAYDDNIVDHLWVGDAVPYEFILELKEAINVTGLKFTKAQWSGLTDFTAHGSNDGSSWTLLHTETGIVGADIETVVTFDITPPPSYTLTVNATNGSVTKSPNKSKYTEGETVTLTATADGGYQFDNWSGDAIGSTTFVDVVMNSNKTVTASFSEAPVLSAIETTSTIGKLTIYPNPSSGQFNISFNSDYIGEVFMEIYTLDGRQIEDLKLSKQNIVFTHQLNLINQALGVYIIQIKAGNYILQQKILKK